MEKEKSIYAGEWKEMLDDNNVIIIVDNDSNLVLNHLKKKKEYVAFDDGRQLCILHKKDTIYAKIDADGQLIIENKRRKKLNGVYKPSLKQ